MDQHALGEAQVQPTQNRNLRRHQFSLRTLFLFVTLGAIACGWLGWQASIVAERKAVKALLSERNIGLAPDLPAGPTRC